MHNPTIKETDLQRVYAMYEDRSVSTDAFKQHCVKIVEEARAPNPQLIRTLPTMSRDKALMSTSNFIMKGHGYGVV